jgi:hypothetical protein
MPEWGICAVRLDEARRRVDRVRCRLVSPAPDGSLVVGEPLDADWVYVANALSQGDRVCTLVQQRGGWRRGAVITANSAAGARLDGDEAAAALRALPRF